MRSEATRGGETTVGGQVLYMALELSERVWKVLFASPAGRRRERSVPARDLGRLLEEIAAAKRRLGLSPQARVVSCYEAGRDGFWLDRALEANGIDNLVVDASSIEVPRRARWRSWTTGAVEMRLWSWAWVSGLPRTSVGWVKRGADPTQLYQSAALRWVIAVA